MNVFTLGLWEIFWWGLNYFDQFFYDTIKMKKKMKALMGFEPCV